MCRSTIDVDPEASTPSPFTGSCEPVKSLRRLWLPYRVSPMCHRGRPYCSAAEATHNSVVRPFRGSFPFSVSPAMRSHIPPAISIPPVTLRPQGFSPSRRFAPHTTCRAYFIPVPLLGFALRGLHPPAAPYAFPDAGSLVGFPPCSEELGPPLQGLQHAAGSPPAPTGV
jgi:hypothetical protein